MMLTAAPTKTRSKCGESKTLDGFNRNPARSDGASTYCTPCERDYARQRVERINKESPPVPPESKTCTSCGETKEPAAFANDRTHKDGLSAVCKPCKTAATKR